MEGPANPALRTEKWHPEFQEELSRVACALRDLTGTRCLPGCEGAGFRADTLPWCWALPQASHTWGMWFLKEQGWLSGEHCSVPSLEHPSAPLWAAQTFAPGACEENTFSPTRKSVVDTAAAKKPLLLLREGWPSSQTQILRSLDSTRAESCLQWDYRTCPYLEF